MQVDSYRGGRQAGAHRDLGTGEPLDQPQHQCLPIGVGKTTDSLERGPGVRFGRDSLPDRQLLRQLDELGDRR